MQVQLGFVPTRLPDLSLAEAERRTRVGRSLLERAQAIDPGGLPHDLALTLRLLLFRARYWAREAEWYWTVADPMGIGYFGMFVPDRLPWRIPSELCEFAARAFSIY